MRTYALLLRAFLCVFWGWIVAGLLAGITSAGESAAGTAQPWENAVLVFSNQELPTKINELHLRFVLFGTIDSSGQDLQARLILLDRSDGRRFEKESPVDLPGLVGIRREVLCWSEPG